MAFAAYRKVTDLPPAIPVFPLDGALLLPGCVLPLNIFEPRYLNMVDDAMASDRLIGMIQNGGGREGLARVGCAGKITSFSETSDGRYLIQLTGVCRFEAGEALADLKPYRRLKIRCQAFGDDLASGEEAPAAFERAPILGLLKAFLRRHGLGADWPAVEAAPGDALIDSLAMALPFAPAEKQALLEAPTREARREALCALLRIGAARRPHEEGDPPAPLQ